MKLTLHLQREASATATTPTLRAQLRKAALTALNRCAEDGHYEVSLLLTDDPGIQALLAALQSQEVKDFINSTYNGAVVPIF